MRPASGQAGLAVGQHLQPCLMAGGGLGQGQHTHLFMSPGLTGEGLGSTPFFFPSSLFPEPEKA